jgi:hypothetical protein
MRVQPEQVRSHSASSSARDDACPGFASIRCRSRVWRLHASEAQLLPPAYSTPTVPRSRGCLEVFAAVVADDCDMEVQAACLWARLALVEVIANEMRRPDERPVE